MPRYSVPPICGRLPNYQIYVSFKTNLSVELQMAKSKVELCVKDIYTWMVHNDYKLNHDNSEHETMTRKCPEVVKNDK